MSWGRLGDAVAGLKYAGHRFASVAQCTWVGWPHVHHDALLHRDGIYRGKVMSYENLAEQHADMLATAYDLKIEVPEELRGDTVDDSVIGALDKLIKEKVVTTEKVKKAPAKKKEAAVKKAAPKAKVKKAAPKKATVKAKPKKNGYDENLKINWLGKDNPARKGSGRYERIENIKKHNSKTIKTFLTSKGSKRGSLTWCVANGLIKVAA